MLKGTAKLAKNKKEEERRSEKAKPSAKRLSY